MLSELVFELILFWSWLHAYFWNAGEKEKFTLITAAGSFVIDEFMI